jgi:hypothetical protein
MIDEFLKLKKESLEVFNSLFSDFSLFHESAINEGKISKEIKLVSWDEPFETPYFNCETKEIFIHEKFLAYLWSCNYIIFFKVESNHDSEFMLKDDEHTLDVNNPSMKKFLDLFNWSRNIQFDNETIFPKDCPNPNLMGNFTEKEKDFIIKSTTLYKVSLAYFLFHEVTHGILDHCPVPNIIRINNKEEEKITSQLIENEADIFARRMLNRDNIEEKLNFNICFGILVGALCLLFCLPKIGYIKGETHPDVDERILRTFRDFKNIPDDKKDYFAEAIVGGFQIFFDMYENNLILDLSIYYEDREKVIEIVANKIDEIKERYGI